MTVGWQQALRVVIAGGGTGGHLYPGIAVARELLSRRPDAQMTFAGTARGIEARVVPREGFALDLIRSGGLKGKSIADRAARRAAACRSGWSTRGGSCRARRPHLVIGVGGYSSGPVVLVAALRGVPTMLLEQNAVPGLTNRLLARCRASGGGDVRIDAGVLRQRRRSSAATRFGRSSSRRSGSLNRSRRDDAVIRSSES